MTAIKCKECSKDFEPESFGEWGSFCPYCATEVREEPQNKSVSELSYTNDSSNAYCSKCSTDLKTVEKTHTLDRKTYCHGCIEEAGLSEFMSDDFRLEESVKFGFGESFLLFVKTYLLFTLSLTLLITGFLILLVAAFRLGGLPAKKTILEQLNFIMQFFAFCFLVFSLVTFPMSLAAFINRRRSIRLENEKLFFNTTFGKKSVPLHECTWMETKFSVENCGCCHLFRLLIYIVTNDGKGIVCGFSNNMRIFWSRYFTFIGLKSFDHKISRKLLKRGIFNLVPGGLIGGLIGFAFELLTGNPIWRGVWILIGFFDSIIFTACFLVVENLSKSVDQEKLSKGLSKLTFCTFFLGLQVGIVGGLISALVCGSINAIFGWFIRRLVMSKIHAFELDQSGPLKKCLEQIGKKGNPQSKKSGRS